MTLEVRDATPEDHAAVGALTVRAYDAVGRVSAAYRETLADVTARTDDRTRVLVATLDGVVVGSVAVPAAGSAHFEHGRHGDGGVRALAVAPEAQGHGVGRALMAAVLDHGRAQGWRRLVFTSMEWMTAAHALYASLGATRRPDLDVRYASGVGLALQLDLTDDADAHFPPPGPVPDELPLFEHAPAAPPGC